MQKIYKYEILAKGFATVPKSARLLRVHAQGDSICLWAAANPYEKETRTLLFDVVPTGIEVPSPLKWNYLDSVFMDNGLVFHVFITDCEETAGAGRG